MSAETWLLCVGNTQPEYTATAVSLRAGVWQLCVEGAHKATAFASEKSEQMFTDKLCAGKWARVRLSTSNRKQITAFVRRADKSNIYTIQNL